MIFLFYYHLSNKENSGSEKSLVLGKSEVELVQEKGPLTEAGEE